MGMRAQSALEFLTTYGWSFIIIALFISVVFVLVSSKGVSTYAPSSCYISPSLPCIAAYASSNSLGSVAIVKFTNQLGTEMSFPANAITIRFGMTYANYTGNCVPANAFNYQQVTCTVNMPQVHLVVGAELNPSLSLKYALCNNKACSAYVYNTSGTATLTVA